MSEQDVYTPIAPTSDEVVAKIRRRTALSLPDDPSAAGMSAETIRRRFWEAICGTDASVLAEMTRIINEANTALGAFDGELGTVRRIYTTPPTSEVRAIESEQQPTVDVSVKEDTGNPVLHFDFAIPKGKQGERGPSGVYVGDGDMPEDASVQIIPDADDFEYYEVVQETGDSKVTVMSQKSVTEQLKQRSNALKGSATGSAVRMDDVSPLEHEMVVKVSGVDEVSAVKVRKQGKNILDINETRPYSESYDVVTVFGDAVSVTAKDDRGSYGVIFDGINLVVGETYSFSMESLTDHAAVWGWRLRYDDGTYSGYSKSLSILMKIEKSVDKVLFQVGSRYTGGKEVILSKPQIELNTATAYAPYIAPTEYAVNADGTVDGVTSLYPTTTLMTDTEGAVIDVEYNRDINKAFDELKQAIISLGGNV